MNSCVKGKQVRVSSKLIKCSSTTKLLKVLCMNLCGHIRIQSPGGRNYMIVIVDNHSMYTWTLFLKEKFKTFIEFARVIKQVQVSMDDGY